MEVPDIHGSGLKIGRHDGGKIWRPGEKLEPFGAFADDEADLRRALESYMPRAAGGGYYEVESANTS